MQYATLTVTVARQVATITMRGRAASAADPPASSHEDMASVFSSLRADNEVRVIVLTGSDNQFKVPGPSHAYSMSNAAALLIEPAGAWRTFSSIVRCLQLMVEIEKPIVAKVNGDAIGFGSSLAFASDFIVASTNALFMDHHMNGKFFANYGGRMLEGGHDFSSVPGDGGLSFIPLSMTPCKAKEYLMLAKPYEAAELARLGIINQAVPAEELDECVDRIVAQLLERDAYALAWTKRVANRRAAEHLNMTLDAGVAYEMVSFLQRERLGGSNKPTLG